MMLCNISQNAMGQTGGYPARSSWGGTLPGGTLLGGGTLAGGGTQLGQQGSTCYTVGGMPLAFTQEDFLVLELAFTALK